MYQRIAVVGIGSLGLCLALNLERAGYHVLGLDINEKQVAAINNRTLRSYEPDVEEYLKAARNFQATTQLADLFAFEPTLIFIVIDTPSLPDGRYNHAKIEAFLDKLVSFGASAKPCHLVINSTTMPGYTNQLAAKMGVFNYTVSYNPEFIAQGTIIRDQQYPDQVLIGEANAEAGDAIQAVYEKVCKSKPTFCRMTRISAEICKVATNCFLTTKISFANSVGDLALAVGAEPDKILAAIGADSRIGGKYIKYGFGYGGPCFPRDNRALGVFARDVNMELPISEATDRVNKLHLEFQFQQYLEQYSPDEVIEFDHVTYKKGSILLEESQQLALAVKLAQAGRKVKIAAEPIVRAEIEKIWPNLFQY